MEEKEERETAKRTFLRTQGRFPLKQTPEQLAVGGTCYAFRKVLPKLAELERSKRKHSGELPWPRGRAGIQEL